MTAAVCAQPGCGGTIEDGYCMVCGIAPAPRDRRERRECFDRLERFERRERRPGVGVLVAGTGTGSGSRRGTRGSRAGSGRSSRGALGAGLVEVPPVPARDPATAILADPRVPENRRFCGNCGNRSASRRTAGPA